MQLPQSYTAMQQSTSRMSCSKCCFAANCRVWSAWPEQRMVMLQLTGFDVVNTWEYPSQPLQIKHVSISSYPDLFFALQVWTGAAVLCHDLPTSP